MQSFKEWFSQFDEVVDFSKAKKVKSSIRKNASYKPGTFGIEIEFPVFTDDGNDIDYDRAHEVFSNNYFDLFYSEVDPSDYDVVNPDEWDDDNPEPITLDDWEEENPAPEDEEENDIWRKKRDDIDMQHYEWLKERKEVAKKWERWEDYGRVDAANEEMTNADIWNYLDISDYKKGGMEETIKEVGEILEGLNQSWEEGDATEHNWGIGPDGDEIVELRSRYLTTKDFPMLLDLFNELNSKIDHSSNKSAHVHIGLQQYDDSFNAMDLLSLLSTIDEDKIIGIAGVNRVVNGRWTKPNPVVVKDMIKLITNKFFPNKDLSKKLEANSSNNEMLHLISTMERYRGTNLKAFDQTGTVEFRYLSSEILKNPKKFLEVIQYYLMLPDLARKKMQIKLDDGNQTLYLTRMPGNNIKITNSSTGHPSMKVPETRIDLAPSKLEKQKPIVINKQIEKSMEDTKKYFKDMSLYDFSTEINKLKSSNSITDPRIKQLIDSISNMTTQYASGYAPSFAKDQKMFDGNNFLRIHGNNLDYLYYKIAQLNLFKKMIPSPKTSLESGTPTS